MSPGDRARRVRGAQLEILQDLHPGLFDRAIDAHRDGQLDATAFWTCLNAYCRALKAGQLGLLELRQLEEVACV